MLPSDDLQRWQRRDLPPTVRPQPTEAEIPDLPLSAIRKKQGRRLIFLVSSVPPVRCSLKASKTLRESALRYDFRWHPSRSGGG